METTPTTKKTALKSFLVLAGAVTAGYILGSFAVTGIHKLMDSINKPKTGV